ncbi:MAG: DUF1573 domain-containing protein [Blastocatellia bacterium]|nr:DUF1573 domain-containing protein [Blastocatellia bacterium]
MIYETKKLYLLFILMAALTSACSVPPDGSSSSADSNAAQAASGAQTGTPSATSPTAQKDPVPLTPKDAAGQGDAGAAKNEDGPKIVVPVKRVEFGEQLEGKTVTRSFIVKNKGKKPLEITAVDASCGCTTVDFPKTIAPGREKSITVKVNIGNVAGEHVKTVTIKSNDPGNPAFIVELAFTTKKMTR